MKILIADDHALTRLFLQLFFDSQPNIAPVCVACNGLEAVALAEQERPDAIILDWQMPMMDGLNAAAQIKQITPQTPIIIFSSAQDAQPTNLEHEGVFDLFLDKATDPEQLLGMIKQLVERMVPAEIVEVS